MLLGYSLFGAWLTSCLIKRFRAMSTDRNILTANKLTANKRFCYSNFVTDFIAVISSQCVGLGKMALWIIKYI